MIISPCINVCRLNAEDRCEGCQRTLGEIATWTRLTDAERARITAELPSRATSQPVAIGGPR